MVLASLLPDLKDSLDFFLRDALVLLEFGPSQENIIACSTEKFIEILEFRVGDVTLFI